ncbi:DUF6318 family protein [Arthrobacter sp. R1-13]
MTARNSVYMRLRVLAAAVVTAGALALSACAGGAPGGGGTPSTPAPTQSTSAPTPSPTPTAVYKPADAKGKAQNVPLPVMPEAAKAETKEGLEAFAKYWYALMNYAYETGNLEPIKSLAAPASSCAMCDKIFPAVEKWNSEGRWVEGASIEVHALQTKFTQTPSGEYQVAIQSQQRAGTLRNADSTVGQTVEETSMLGDLLIAKFVSGEWLVTNVDRLGG